RSKAPGEFQRQRALDGFGAFILRSTAEADGEDDERHRDSRSKKEGDGEQKGEESVDVAREARCLLRENRQGDHLGYAPPSAAEKRSRRNMRPTKPPTRSKVATAPMRIRPRMKAPYRPWTGS